MKMSFLADIFLPSGRTERTATAETEEFNKIRLEQIMQLIEQEGGLAELAAPRPDLFSLDALSQAILGETIGEAREPGLTTDEFIQRTFDAIAGGESAAQQVLQNIITPTLQNRASAAGIGRSGAVQEAVAQAGTQLALPLAQQLFQFTQNLPGVDIDLRAARLGRLGGALDLSRIPQQLDIQDFLRRSGIIQPSITGIPFTPTGTTTESTNLLTGLNDLSTCHNYS